MRATKGKKADVVRLEPRERIEGPRVGRVVSCRAGEVKVEVPGRSAAVTARLSAALDDATLERAARDRQEALLLFEEGDPARPVIVSLLRSATPHLDAALTTGPLPAGEKVARVDGRRVEIEGREEVVLRCGKASITLRRDGKVVVRGVDVVTQADAVQKIRGGKIRIN